MSFKCFHYNYCCAFIPLDQMMIFGKAEMKKDNLCSNYSWTWCDMVQISLPSLVISAGPYY